MAFNMRCEESCDRNQCYDHDQLCQRNLHDDHYCYRLCGNTHSSGNKPNKSRVYFVNRENYNITES